MIQIAKRTFAGWTPYRDNKSHTHCDDCGERLYVAPDGKTLYCDKNTTKHLLKNSKGVKVS